MKRALAVLLLAGCFPTLTGAPCRNTGECPKGQVCMADGKCDYGTGGSGGGAAGGTAGGGTAGGGTAGGAAGGAAGGTAGGSGGGGTLLVDGAPCTSASQCQSNACNAYFVDADDDDFGTGPSSLRCGATAPTGFASAGGDCCDSDRNAFPGQVLYFSMARNSACGASSWDYDCHGSSDAEPLATMRCMPSPMCHMCAQGLGWAKPTAPACGATDDQVTSVSGTPMSPPCVYTTAMIMMVAAKCR